MDIYHPYTIALLHHSFAMSEGTLVGLHRLILITVPIAEPVPVPGHRGGCIGGRGYSIGGGHRGGGGILNAALFFFTAVFPGVGSTAEACTRILYICVTSYSIARQHIFVGGLGYCVARWSPWLRGLPHWVAQEVQYAETCTRT